MGSVVKNLPPNARDTGSISGSGRSPGAGNGNPLHYFCLENSMDREIWWTPVRGVTKESDTTQRVHGHTHMHIHGHIHTVLTVSFK